MHPIIACFSVRTLEACLQQVCFRVIADQWIHMYALRAGYSLGFFACMGAAVLRDMFRHRNDGLGCACALRGMLRELW